MKNWMKSSFFLNQKNIKVKPIESYKSREKYQVDIIFFNFVWNGFKYIFTILIIS